MAVVVGRAAPGDVREERAPGRAVRSVWVARLQSPLAAYYLLLGSTVALTTLGLVMVLSSSSVESFRQYHSAFYLFNRQLVFAVLAIPLAWVASRVPIRWWKRAAWPLLAFAFLGMLLVFTGLGAGAINGNQGWVRFGPVQVQPAETVKLALVVWGAALLSAKRPLLDRPLHVAIPLLPGAALLLAPVLVGNDLGTAMVILGVLAALLVVAGVPARLLAAAGTAGLLLVWMMVAGSSNRTHRISTWLQGSDCKDILDSCLQTTHGRWALATGGWWGLGLGGSREKWSWLPEAHNDFIFAVIGEELGLVGSLGVLLLFALLGLGLYRLVVSTDDQFVKVAAGGVFAWVMLQALINIGAVLGLLPVIGLPLPLVSAGGSALVMTLVALGMVIGFARRVPGAQQALSARQGVVARSLAVVPLRRRRTVRPAGASSTGSRARPGRVRA